MFILIQVVDMKQEMEQMGRAQDALEKRMEEERKSAMEVRPPAVKTNALYAYYISFSGCLTWR